jgi:glycosyltransferase involved in cell wall biosynthesis
MVLDKHDYDRNSRVHLEARCLSADGHHVFVVCDHVPDKPANEIRKEAEIIRLPRGSRAVRLLYRLADGIGLVCFLFGVRWFLALARIHRERRFDAIHLHDLPLARTVLVFARLARLPVVLDLHENYPVLMQSFVPEGRPDEEHRRIERARTARAVVWYVKGKLREWTLDPGRWAVYERKAVRAAEQVVVVIEEAGDRVAELGVPRDRITVVSNTLSDEFLLHASRVREDPDIVSALSSRFVIPYVGSLPLFVRIETLIRALPEILRNVPNAHLLVLGEVEKRLPAFSGLVDDLDLAEHVTFERWQPVERFHTYLRMADIGILPWEPDGHTNATIPHKLFQYMYLQLPIIASECAPLARIITECRCGLVMPGLATDPQQAARAVIRLAADPEERRAMGNRGREAVLSRYRWTADSERLSQLYRRVAPH